MSDQTLNFGFSTEALGPTLDAIKANGVEILFTCMDVAANLRVLEGMQNAGLSTAMYWPQGYEQAFLNEEKSATASRTTCGPVPSSGPSRSRRRRG